MKRSTFKRRTLLALLLTGSTAVATTGCSTDGTSLASANPFAKSSTGPAATASVPSQSLAQAKAAGQTDSSDSFGSKAKDAVFKTASSVTGMFSKNKTVSTNEVLPADDPLALDNVPDKIDPEVFVANGQLWESTGNFPKAMESYTKALEQEPNHVPALASIARLHFHQGSFQQAANFFQKAIAKKPDDSELYHDLGLTLGRLGQPTLAVQTLARALEMSPGNSRYANNLASVHFEAGNPQAAFEVLSQNNQPAVAHFNMAYLCYKHGQMDDARGHLNETLKFESLAATDSTVKRAVDRSRKLLKQIENPATARNIQSRGQQSVPAIPAAARVRRPVPDVKDHRSPQRQLRQTQTPTPAAAPAAAPGATAPMSPQTAAMTNGAANGSSVGNALALPQSNAQETTTPTGTTSGMNFSLPGDFSKTR